MSPIKIVHDPCWKLKREIVNEFHGKRPQKIAKQSDHGKLRVFKIESQSAEDTKPLFRTFLKFM